MSDGDDTLANVTGRAYLVAELDRVCFQLSDEISAAYSEVRMTRKRDRREFVQSIENLKNMAFMQARAVECGTTDMCAILTVFNAMREIDLIVHRPDLTLGRSKAQKDNKLGFLPKEAAIPEWQDAYQTALSELKAEGKKRPQSEAARRVVARLNLQLTPKHVLWMLKKK